MIDEDLPSRPRDAGQPEEDLARREKAADRRLVCQFALILALVFVVAAMEEGSYRVSWPVALLVSGAALGICLRLYTRKKT
jgi:hypothetical protein